MVPRADLELAVKHYELQAAKAAELQMVVYTLQARNDNLEMANQQLDKSRNSLGTQLAYLDRMLIHSSTTPYRDRPATRCLVAHARRSVNGGTQRPLALRTPAPLQRTTTPSPHVRSSRSSLSRWVDSSTSTSGPATRERSWPTGQCRCDSGVPRE